MEKIRFERSLTFLKFSLVLVNTLTANDVITRHFTVIRENGYISGNKLLEKLGLDSLER